MLSCGDKDGANALLEIRQSASYNFAQNQETCVVFRMSRAAIVVIEIVPVQKWCPCGDLMRAGRSLQ